MADAGAGRHHPEVVGRPAVPSAERRSVRGCAAISISTLTAEGFGSGIGIDHHRVVDDQVDRDLRVDQRRVAAGAGQRIAHGGQVDHRRHAGEILHQHPSRAKRDFVVGAVFPEPAEHGQDIVAGDGLAILAAQQVLEQDLQRHRQTFDPRLTSFGQGGQRKVLVACPARHKGAPGTEAIGVGIAHHKPPHAKLFATVYHRRPGCAGPEHLAITGGICYLQGCHLTPGKLLMDLALLDQTLFAITYRQYGLALLAVLVALASKKLIAFLLTRLVAPLTRRTETDLDDHLLECIRKPLELLVLIIGLFVAVQILQAAGRTDRPPRRRPCGSQGPDHRRRRLGAVQHGRSVRQRIWKHSRPRPTTIWTITWCRSCASRCESSSSSSPGS